MIFSFSSHLQNIVQNLYPLGCKIKAEKFCPFFWRWDGEENIFWDLATFILNGSTKVFRGSTKISNMGFLHFLRLRLGAQSFTLLITLRDPTQLRRRQWATRQQHLFFGCTLLSSLEQLISAPNHEWKGYIDLV